MSKKSTVLLLSLAFLLPSAPLLHGTSKFQSPSLDKQAYVSSETFRPEPEIQTANPVPPSESADLILFNGNVLTMDPNRPTALAVAIRDGQIVAVGSMGEVMRWNGHGTKRVNLKGRTVMPGFVDSHSHVFLQPESVGETPDTIQDRLLREGITTITEMGVFADEGRALQEMEEDGSIRLRVSAYLYRTDNCGNSPPDHWYREFPKTIEPGTLLHFPGVKAFADGGSCGVPAVSFEYPVGGNGDLFHSQTEMDAMVSEAEDNGYQLAVHALGDRAVEQVLEAYEDELADAPSNPLRHRIEHNAVVPPELIDRYDETGVVATLFGAFPACFHSGDRGSFDYVTPDEYLSWEWPYRDLIQSNPDTVFAWHGDVPIFTLDPFAHLFGLVARQEKRPDGSICRPPEALAGQEIPVEEALKMMTRDAAYALRRDRVGVLATGMQADLIVLSRNPLTAAPEALTDIQVLLTMVGGQVEHCVNSKPSPCPR